MFEPLQATSLGQQVFQTLRDRILKGELPAESALPAERQLAEGLGVNRGALREGLQRLQQAGLIRIRHGESTRVTHWQDQIGLEQLPALLQLRSTERSAELVLGIMRLREDLAPSIAALAAERRQGRQLAQLRQRLRALRDAPHSAARLVAAHDYWQQLVLASSELIYRLAWNALRNSYLPLQSVLAPVLDPEFRDLANLQDLQAAVEAGDPKQARSCAAQHVVIGTRCIARWLDDQATPTGNSKAHRSDAR